MKMIYPDKPKRVTSYIGGGITKREYFPAYLFMLKNGGRMKTNIDYGRGYLDALRDVKRLNH